jgi:excisionase family DNA binding protein
MTVPTKKQFYSIRETAEFLGVSDRTVKREIKAGRLAIRKVGRRTILDRDDLERFLEAGGRSAR